jgi:methionyl-tRNA formyltransferase
MFFCNCEKSGEIVAQAIREQTHELLYKKVKRIPTKKELSIYKQQIKDIDNVCYFTESDRVRILNKIREKLFFKEVLRSWAK